MRAWCLSLACICCLLGCRRQAPPVISFTVVPPAAPAGSDTAGEIAGRVTHAPAGSYLLLFAHANFWWAQPDAHGQRIVLQPDGSWHSTVHLGTEYGAALVSGDFKPSEHSTALPQVGGAVRAVTTVAGIPVALLRADGGARTVQFGGFDWTSTSELAQMDGQYHFYLSRNVAVDAAGRLHLRIRSVDGFHTCAEIRLPQTLGYGTYRFSMAVPTDLDPAAEFTFFIAGSDEQPGVHREIEINLSRWGDVRSQNAEYVVEPYFVSANVHRFELQPGQVMSTLAWAPGSIRFDTVRTQDGQVIARWDYNASVPVSRNERVFFNFCPFAYPLQPFRQDTEIVVQQFEFVP